MFTNLADFSHLLAVLRQKYWTNLKLFKFVYQVGIHLGDSSDLSVVDPKLFFSDPYPDLTFQEISDPDSTQLLSKEAKV